ncbi:alpha/beta hydrolase [Acinetobacter sp. B5B]|uniref:alpha/beta fold hydrolase n=1 Tax=Acinetobacter baretiae TaxID=2605383 RepID=UPI0018C2F34A|nr:alpha/beta hydrolase [Acinetobacter baretiae]MBF7683314.1 alpha/beta hydrolase [Acinetobacter baretiae]MBF7686018.1 alpha/beta hydrolase [Acinetobacter baretiae]
MTVIHTNDNTALYVKDWGEGEPVILLHGWPLSADSWDWISLKLVESGYRVISYDRRGFGRSDQPWQGYDYDTLADDLKNVIEDKQLKDVSIVGFSMGGGEVARYLSRHHSQYIKKVALISSVVPFLAKTDDHVDGVDGSVFEGMIDGILDDRYHFFTEFFKDFYGVGTLSQDVSPEFLAWNVQVASQASLKSTIDCVRAFAYTDFRPDLSAFDVPTLVIHGTQDKTVPIAVTAHAVKNALPHAHVIEYEGEPHGVLETQKARVAQDLINFFKD